MLRESKGRSGIPSGIPSGFHREFRRDFVGIFPFPNNLPCWDLFPRKVEDEEVWFFSFCGMGRGKGIWEYRDEFWVEQDQGTTCGILGKIPLIIQRSAIMEHPAA